MKRGRERGRESFLRITSQLTLQGVVDLYILEALQVTVLEEEGGEGGKKKHSLQSFMVTTKKRHNFYILPTMRIFHWAMKRGGKKEPNPLTKKNRFH